uniref:Myomesin 3 n=1 Tax=Sinocyclocheilus rhinocerous TaxID=307959 RepID=A0A673JX38_9TELE
MCVLPRFCFIKDSSKIFPRLLAPRSYTICRSTGKFKLSAICCVVPSLSLCLCVDGPAVVLGAPGSPLQLQCSDVNWEYVFLSCIPPSADGAAAVQGYFIERCDIGVGKWERCNAVIHRECQYPVMGLKENTMYQFRVCAVNQAAVGRPFKLTGPFLTSDPLEPSRTTMVKVERGREIVITKDQLEGQIRVPFPSTDVRVCELSDTYAVLSWTEPDPRGREPLTYSVERVRVDLRPTHCLQFSSLRPALRAPGKSYTYRVRSVNKYGISEPVSLWDNRVPTPPHGVLPIRDTNSSVLLQWKEPKITEGIVGYYLYYSEVGSGQWKTINNKPITKTRFTVDGLKTNKDYVFRGKSVGLVGNSIYSDESPAIRVKSAIYVPSRPSAIALLRCTGSEVLIGWRAPANHGGDPVRGYFLDQREKSQSSWREINVKPAKESVYEVTGLQEGSFYQFRVFAANIVSSVMFIYSCPFDLEFRKVRRNSLVLLWAEPLYKGQSEISGYIVEISEGAESEDWTPVLSEPVTETQRCVPGLQTGQTYRLRVSAVNAAGVAGTKEIEIGVDNDGFIFLSFEALDRTDKDVFKWSKNYGKAIDARRARPENKNNRSLVDVSEQGSVLLWLQTEALSSYSTSDLLNDFCVDVCVLQTRKINFDRAQGLVEILFDQISREDEGSYTAQLKDGRAKNQFTLVFSDIWRQSYLIFLQISSLFFCPHFEEFLSWTVTSDCEMIMRCKVTNVSKDTRVKWFKDGVGLPQAVSEPTGVPLLTRKELGVYRALPLLDKRIGLEERTKPGSSMQKVWIEIFSPTEKDKGKYTLEMFDGQETHKRSLDLSGQGRADSITKGLPDVVAIMENKSLCLTGFADGDPVPEMFWLKNNREVTSTGQYNIKKENKSSTLTINHVTMEDSGNYSINKHGSQTVLVTVGVYKRGEKPRADAVQM